MILNRLDSYGIFDFPIKPAFGTVSYFSFHDGCEKYTGDALRQVGRVLEVMNVWSKKVLARATQMVSKAHSRGTCKFWDHITLMAGNHGYELV